MTVEIAKADSADQPANVGDDRSRPRQCRVTRRDSHNEEDSRARQRGVDTLGLDRDPVARILCHDRLSPTCSCRLRRTDGESSAMQWRCAKRRQYSSCQLGQGRVVGRAGIPGLHRCG